MSKQTYDALESLGRERLSEHFYMRQFLYSEISNAFGIPNIPDDIPTALKAGRCLATRSLDPLVDTFGKIEIRSAYRSPEVNTYGNQKSLNCGSNEGNKAHHIWDQRDKDGNLGATACIFIPWFTEQYNKGRDWRDLAYWLHDHIEYSEIVFFSKNCAFNLNWRENPKRRVASWITGGKGGCPVLIQANKPPEEAADDRRNRYSDFPGLQQKRTLGAAE